MAGAPEGNKNSSKTNRLWGETIRRAALHNDAEKLRKIADKLFDLAEQGDMAAIREIGDRIDGKPAQVIAGDAENPINLIGEIRRVIVKSGNTDS